ncbi:MAG: ribokinase [Ignavibacteriales bacterium]|nr:ribokinase [Ignavibacteriales bacterium]
MKPKIVVVGSSNTDMIMKLPRLPKRGETVIDGSFAMAAGGKGANQAVAAARAGGDVTLLTKVGSDQFGSLALEGFRKEGINIDYVGIDSSSPSGVAVIFVDGHGENSIGVASGANGEFQPSDLSEGLDRISSADILLVQLEIPLPTVEAAIRCAAQTGVRVIVNPAPARKLDAEVLRLVSVITPNQAEAEILSGVPLVDDKSLERGAKALHAMGVRTVVITLGERGAFLAGAGNFERIPAFDVEPVDTTAAGDVFNGALAVSIGEGRSLLDAIRFANAASALSVQKLGAQPSAPRRREILDFMKSRTREEKNLSI